MKLRQALVINTLILVTITALLVTPTRALSSGKPQFSHQGTTIRVATTTIQPWGDVMIHGNKHGLLGIFAEELALRSNMKIENSSRPYPRVIYEIGTGQTDMAVMFTSPQANDIGISLGKVTSTQIILVGLNTAPVVEHLDELSGYMIGHISGSKYGPLFDNHRGINKTPILSMEQGIKMLLRGRIHAMASADQTLYFTLAKMGIASDQVKPILTLSNAYAELYFSRKSPNKEFIPKFKAALDQMHQDGSIHRIFVENGYLPTAAIPLKSKSD